MNTALQQDGIIMVETHGDQTFETVFRIAEQFKEFSKELTEVKVLFNLTDLGKINIGTRKAAF